MFQIGLSEIELDRILVLKEVKEGFLTQQEAGDRLGLSQRQIRRLLKRIAVGAEGIKSQRKGGNRAFSSDFKEIVLIKVRERYPDFGPTFAAEKLMDCEKLKVSKETLRKWMMAEGLWKGRARKQGATVLKNS